MASDLVRMTVYNAATQQYEERLVPSGNFAERLQVAQYESTVSAHAFQDYLTSLFKRTLDNARNTYRLLSAMSIALFTIGVGLFVFAALYASISHTRVYSLVFAGLGATSFVTLFIAKPYKDAQVALSNMVQSEMAFMAFFEQIRMWASYPWTEDGVLNPRKVETASDRLHTRTLEAMDDFQRYVEAEQTRTRRNGASRKDKAKRTHRRVAIH